MTEALAAFGAVVAFLFCWIAVAYVGWAMLRLYERRLYRKAIEQRLDEFAYGDCPSVTELLSHNGTPINTGAQR